jgi:hypothetical protein
MNHIQTIETQYIRYARRSLDTVEVKQSEKCMKTFWVYNYEGWHFRVFESLAKAEAFLDNESYECLIDFVCEKELDDYLLNYKIE